MLPQVSSASKNLPTTRAGNARQAQPPSRLPARTFSHRPLAVHRMPTSLVLTRNTFERECVRGQLHRKLTSFQAVSKNSKNTPTLLGNCDVAVCNIGIQRPRVEGLAWKDTSPRSYANTQAAATGFETATHRGSDTKPQHRKERGMIQQSNRHKPKRCTQNAHHLLPKYLLASTFQPR